MHYPQLWKMVVAPSQDGLSPSVDSREGYGVGSVAARKARFHDLWVTHSENGRESEGGQGRRKGRQRLLTSISCCIGRAAGPDGTALPAPTSRAPADPLPALPMHYPQIWKRFVAPSQAGLPPTVDSRESYGISTVAAWQARFHDLWVMHSCLAGRGNSRRMSTEPTRFRIFHSSVLKLRSRSCARTSRSRLLRIRRARCHPPARPCSSSRATGAPACGS